MLGLPRSTYHRAARPRANPCPDHRLGPLIQTIFHANRRCYGYRRIARELEQRGIPCGQQRIRGLMRRQGLHALQRKRFTPRTSDGKASRPCPNLLAQSPPPDAPNQIWTGDITFIRGSGGWLYLAVVIDLCSRRIIGWSIAETMHTGLVIDALRQALQSRKRSSATIFHSDRGSQYASEGFRRLLIESGMRQSMSRLANPYDNAWTESFMGTLKTEMSGEAPFSDLHDARRKLFDYIDAFYNSRRLHSSIGYLSPNRFEAKLEQSR